MKFKYILTSAILLATYVYPALASKKTFTALPGAMFNIDSYDSATQTYSLTYLKYPAQGPLVTTPEYLAQAIPTIKLDRIQRSPDSVVDHQFQTDKTLILLMPEAIEERKKALNPGTEKTKTPAAKSKAKN